MTSLSTARARWGWICPASSADMRLLPADARAGAPWRNGGGVTYEVAAGPEGAGFDDFGWRISIARIERDGPFSAFPGIDRTQMVLEGGPVILSGTDWEVGLHEGSASLAFDGERPIDARVATPATVLNVMTRRGTFHHRLQRASPVGMKNAVAVLLLADRALEAAGTRLQPLDAIWLDPDEVTSLMQAADQPGIWIAIGKAD